MGPIERFFSDRGRGRKAAACAGSAALLSIWFVFWTGSDRPSFSKIIQEPDRWIGEVAGPEYMQAISTGPGEVILEAGFATPLRFRLPTGPEGEALRKAAAELEPTEWVSVAALYLGNLTFEARVLMPEPNRKIKFAVSGAAALAAIGAVLACYRWRRGALRPRSGERGAGPAPGGGS